MAASYYGVLFQEYWTGPTGREIRRLGGKDAQLLGAYLCSCRFANMIGLFRAPLTDVCHDLDMPPEDILAAFEVLAAAKFAYYDRASEVVWVRQMARIRLGLSSFEDLSPGDKRVAGCNRLYEAAPPNPYLTQFYNTYKTKLHIRGRRAPVKALTRPLQGATKGLPSVISNQDQVQKDKNGAAEAARPQPPVENSKLESEDVPYDSPPRPREKPDVRLLEALIRKEHLPVEPVNGYDEGDLVEVVKLAAARRDVAYDTESIRKAIESERYKQRRGLGRQGPAP